MARARELAVTVMEPKKRTLGIRREEKSRWERRAPLAPEHVRKLREQHGIETVVQPSRIRVFDDEAYRAAGARVDEDLSGCNLVVAVKEIPKELLRRDGAYMFFSHTMKAQPYNMPLLGRVLDLDCTLLDHEKVTDDQGRRLVLFGVHAGLAGMIDSLWALGQRLEVEGIETPLAKARPAHEYAGLDAALEDLREIGAALRREGGLPTGLGPLVVGIAGYGNVSRGAQQVLDQLEPEEVAPEALDGLRPGRLYKVVFREEHMVSPVEPGAPFDLQTYYQHPDRFRGTFERWLPRLTALVNCIYWEQKYPRLVTVDGLRALFSGPDKPSLRVIGDISCDVEGSIEATTKTTQPDDPAYVFDPATRTTTMGFEGNGPVIMAVDNLPCELPREATESFGSALVDLVADAVVSDYSAPFDALRLPPELKRAVIAHRGELAPSFRYLEGHAIRGADRRSK
jgi:saccharopine dehydrogenase (NAD+, L-lysine-forming)